MKITQEQYWQLKGLDALAAQNRERLEQIRTAVEGILGGDLDGHVDDFVWGERPLDEMLEITEVSVEAGRPRGAG